MPSRTGSFDAHRAAVSAFSQGDKAPAPFAPKGRDRLAIDFRHHAEVDHAQRLVGWVEPTGTGAFTVGSTHPTNGSTMRVV